MLGIISNTLSVALLVVFLSPVADTCGQSSIIFPNANTNDCFLDKEQRVKGVFRNIIDCPTAYTQWINRNITPQTCYYSNQVLFVCCEKENQHEALESRTSEIACNFYRPPLVPPAFLKLGVHVTVVHGTLADADEFPYMAALGWRSNSGDSIVFLCGGVLISERNVLTAAHCASIGIPHLVRLGGKNLNDTAQLDIKVKRFIQHPSYKANQNYHDIAIIELERDTSSVAPACLWHKSQVSTEPVTAIGYGHTRFAGSGSNGLLKTVLRVMGNEDCKKSYPPDLYELPFGLTESHICAHDPDKLRDTCQGDSGGPLLSEFFVESDTRPYVLGITSFGQGCGGGPPSVYTRVQHYIEWIEKIVWPNPAELKDRKARL